MIAHAGVYEVVGDALGGRGGHCQNADDDVLLANEILEPAVGAHLDRADRVADLRLVGVEDGGDGDAVLAEDRRAGNRLAEPACAHEGDVVLTLCAQDLADLGEKRVDRVADAALAELAERGEVAADLRRIDVRVVGDLLRRDAVLAHLLGLAEHLEVARKPRCDTDAHAILQRIRALDGTLQHVTRIVPEPLEDGIRLVTSSGAGEGLQGQHAPESRRLRPVDRDPLAVDLDHGDPLPVETLELGLAGDVELLDREAELLAGASRAPRARARRGGSCARRRASPCGAVAQDAFPCVHRASYG